MSAGAGTAGSMPPRVLILGIGNLLWADEGFGVRCVEALAARWRFAPHVRLLDGGTQGLYLVDEVRGTDVLLVFDAVDFGRPPGTLVVVEGDAVPAWLGAKKMSLHQTGFQEVLALAALFGDGPRALCLVGVQPAVLDDFGGSLRPEVRAGMEPALAAGLDWLAARGVRPLAAAATGAAGEFAAPHPALGLARYEQGRPDAASACRRGDARVLGRVVRKLP